jgi:hypothetical protein
MKIFSILKKEWQELYNASQLKGGYNEPEI